MQATMQVPKAMLDKFEAELARERDDQRREAVAELAKLEAEFPTIAEPLDKLIAEADAKAAAARQALRDAEAKARDARQSRSSQTYPHERQWDGLRARLEGELRHSAISDALAEIAGIEDNRHAGNGSDDPEFYAKRAKLFAWCRSTRLELLALQFTDPDPVKAVSKLMETRP